MFLVGRISFCLFVCLCPVEGEAGGPIPSPDSFQDALSKKQRRPQEDERRRKEQGAGAVSPSDVFVCEAEAACNCHYKIRMLLV